MSTFQRGTAIKITSTCKDANGNLTTPSGGVTIDIQKDGESAVVSGQGMTSESTGVMVYVWQSATDNPIGIYGVKTTAIHSGYTSIENTEDLIILKD